MATQDDVHLVEITIYFADKDFLKSSYSEDEANRIMKSLQNGELTPLSSTPHDRQTWVSPYAITRIEVVDDNLPPRPIPHIEISFKKP